jgi:hypothetical protein
MTEADYGTFDRAFRRVVGAFRLRLKATELDDLSRTYFRMLDGHPLDRVLFAGKACITSSRKFPLAADWIAELTATRAIAPPDVRHLSVDELDEYDAAERARWERPPCGCGECVRAGVDDRPGRFVPTWAAAEVDERGFDPRRRLVHAVGHWAHGAELAAWYDARDRFYRSAPRKFRHVLRALAAVREPGEEG